MILVSPEIKVRKMKENASTDSLENFIDLSALQATFSAKKSNVRRVEIDMVNKPRSNLLGSA